MTDDKGAGEGPYLWGYDSYDDMCIFGPSLDENGWNPYKLKKIYRVCEKLNSAYAEGRKSMEKEFKEAIGWADSICFDRNYSKDYKKWKKERAIE